ncbi:hypothetical protein V494_07895, partial [Pseudogymnoascus sp. VKM F-4513 (FW-928)]
MVLLHRNPYILRHLHRRATAQWTVPRHHAFAAGLRRFTTETRKLASAANEGATPPPQPQTQHYGAIVVGGGPAGLATVGTLLDEDVAPILWVDEAFQGGRLNAQYREVP